MSGCLACELAAGERELPGGRIHTTEHWVVEHCVGPLGVGTLIVKPIRHITHVWELEEPEAAELGPLLRRMTAAQRVLLGPEQVYVTLWSHAGGTPTHIHWVLQPVGNAAERLGGLVGPHLQTAMFDRDEAQSSTAVSAFADELRAHLARG